MILLWKHDDKDIERGRNSIVAPDYFLRLRESSLLEGAHVFTCFQNRMNKDFLPGGQSPEWTVGSVVRVYREKRVPRLGAKDPVSHTCRIYDAPSLVSNMNAWGPYHSNQSARLREILLQRNDSLITLIGTFRIRTQILPFAASENVDPC